MWMKGMIEPQRKLKVCKGCRYFTHGETKYNGVVYHCDFTHVACETKEEYENQPVHWLCPNKAKMTDDGKEQK